MFWNHRVIRHKNYANEDYFTIEEVYFEQESPQIPVQHTTDLKIYGDTIDELRWTLENMIKALDEPIIDELKDTI